MMSEKQKGKQPEGRKPAADKVVDEPNALCRTCDDLGHSWERCTKRCQYCAREHFGQRCPAAMDMYPSQGYHPIGHGQERMTLANLQERNKNELARAVALETEVRMLEQFNQMAVPLPGSPAAIAAAKSEFTFRPKPVMPVRPRGQKETPFKLLSRVEYDELNKNQRQRYRRRLKGLGLELPEDNADVENTEAAASGRNSPEHQAGGQGRDEGNDTVQAGESSEATPATKDQEDPSNEVELDKDMGGVTPARRDDYDLYPGIQ